MAASAAVGSASSGTSRSPTWTASVSNVLYSSSVARSRVVLSCAHGSSIRRKAVTGTFSRGGMSRPGRAAPATVDAAKGAPTPGRRYRFRSPLTSTSATETKSVSRRSSQVSCAGSKVDLHLTKGERQDRVPEVSIGPVRRPERPGEGAIVEVAGVPEPGIVRLSGRRPGRREQKGIGVEGRREIVRPLLGALRVKEREFGEGEQLIRAPPPGHDLGVERPERRLGVLVESIVQIGPVEDDLRESARFAGGEDVPRQLPLRGLGIHLGDTDGRGAGADRQRHGEQTDPSPGHPVPARG